MIRLKYMKELMLIKAMSHANVLFVIIITFLKYYFRFEPKICDGCHNLMQNAISFNNVAIASVNGYNYRLHLRYMNKDEAVYITTNSDLS